MIGPALLVALLTGAAVAAPVTAFTAGVHDEGSAFTVLFRLVLIPMTLFSGTFFPIDRLPEWVQPITWVSPLWHGTELARAAASATPRSAVGRRCRPSVTRRSSWRWWSAARRWPSRASGRGCTGE